MNWAIWYLLFIVLFASYYQRRRRMRQILHKHMMNKRKGVSNMNELIKAYIGKERKALFGHYSGNKENWK